MTSYIKPISTVIKERLDKSNYDYKCNNNISAFINDNELNLIEEEVEEKIEAVLQSLIIDTANDHNTKNTAKRVAKMFIRETFSGRYLPVPKITSFPNVGYKSMYTSGPISIKSTCAHHLQNIVGKAYVGIIPEKDVIGLSKFNRIIHHIAERPQIQEEMTSQVADALIQYAKTQHIAVIIKAEHMCLTHRGIREHENDMTTAIMNGAFHSDPSTRQEFYNLYSNMK